MNTYKNLIEGLKTFFASYWLLILLVSTKLILQFVFVNPVYELHRDEFLYLDQAFHPAAGYISVPPFTSWISDIIFLLGGGIFWIRFFPALFGVLTLIIVWFTVDELGGRFYAKFLASVTYIFSVFMRMNVLFQPNAFDILIWTALFFLLIKYIKNQQLKWLLCFSVVTALGVYNKYTVIFLIVGLFAGLLLTRQRSIFAKKGFYMAFALCLVLLLPNILWQISNGFPVIHHMEALDNNQLVNINRMDFLFDQLKYGLVGVVTIISFTAFFFFKAFKPYRFVGYSFLIVMLLYFLSRAKSYYAFGLYPVLFAMGSVYLEAASKKWKKVVVLSLAIMSIAIFLIIARFIMPVLSPAEIRANHETFEKIGLLRWEDGRNHDLPQDFADMTGWKEMAEKALEAFYMIPECEEGSTLVLCENYGQAGALNYYNRGSMPEAFSFNTDYIYWLPELKRIDNVVYVGKQPGPEIITLFKEFKKTGVVENEYSRENGTGIFLLTGADPVFTELFYQKVNERKRNLDIF